MNTFSLVKNSIAINKIKLDKKASILLSNYYSFINNKFLKKKNKKRFIIIYNKNNTIAQTFYLYEACKCEWSSRWVRAKNCVGHFRYPSRLPFCYYAYLSVHLLFLVFFVLPLLLQAPDKQTEIKVSFTFKHTKTWNNQFPV